VKTPFSNRNLSLPTQRRIELAIAVAQERLLNTHVDHALKLIEMVGEQVPFDNALAIYHRLLRVADDEARVITTRALARIGEDSAEAEVWPELMNGRELPASELEDDRSFFENLMHRLRGRVNEELRRWIELAAARTEVALMAVHVENAMAFVDILEKEMSLTEAVELYLEALNVRDAIAEVVYYQTLAKLSGKYLPPVIPGHRLRPAAVPVAAGEERHLRVVEADGG